MDILHITLFGHITVAYPNPSAQLKLSRSSQALLAYFLLQPRPVHRDVLMEVFWGDYATARARSSLTTALWRLRQMLEPTDVRPGTYLIAHPTGEVGFNWESRYWLDIAAFERTIQQVLYKAPNLLVDADIQRVEDVLPLYRGELLEGLYADWALRERERFRLLYLNCLIRLMEFYAGTNRIEQGAAYAQAVLRLDPLREEIYRYLMRMYLVSGQRSLAIRQYIQCRESLQHELGILPLEETELLYRQILASVPTDPPFDDSPPGDLPLISRNTAIGHDVPLPERSEPPHTLWQSHDLSQLRALSQTHDLSQLMQELQVVRHSLEVVLRAVVQVTQALDRLTARRKDSPDNHHR